MKSFTIFITVCCWTCTFLCGLFTIEAQAQDTLGWGYANQLYGKGNYRKASIEFERLLFQTNNPEWQTKASLMKANCYKQLGRFSDGQRCLERVNVMFLPDSLHHQVHHQAALCAYLGQNWKDAESHLLQMENFIKDKGLLEQSIYLKILVLNEQARWSEAKTTLHKLVEAKANSTVEKDSLSQLVEAMYSRKMIPRLKNAKAADRLSTIAPGLGQTYLGYPHEGALSAVLILGSIGFSVYSFLSANYVTTFTVGSYFIQSFYYGNIRRTAFLADKKNHRIKRRFNDPARGLVMSFQKL